MSKREQAFPRGSEHFVQNNMSSLQSTHEKQLVNILAIGCTNLTRPNQYFPVCTANSFRVRVVNQWVWIIIQVH